MQDKTSNPKILLRVPEATSKSESSIKSEVIRSDNSPKNDDNEDLKSKTNSEQDENRPFIKIKIMSFSIKKLLVSLFTLVLLVAIISQIIGLFIFDLVKVGERQVAVVTRFGNISDVKKSGWFFKIPWVENATIYDTSLQTESFESVYTTKDKQDLKLKINLQYQIKSDQVKEIYKISKDQDYLNNQILEPKATEAISLAVSKYDSDTILSDRLTVKKDITLQLAPKFDALYNILTDVNIQSVEKGEVLSKQQELDEVALQTNLDIAKAKSEAEKIKIIGDALRQYPEMLQKEKIDKWDGQLSRDSDLSLSTNHVTQ